MCDTFIALGSATADGGLVFGKNSDRPADEKQVPISIPSRHHRDGLNLRCTYIEIPQVSETFAVVLSQPTWMWGAEMAANEQGVVIGNEAVWTTAPLGPPALLGMDLVRLGAERGATAKAAVEVITDLLQTHGQGGGCGQNDPGFQYHNSFLIADATEAWVLETADRKWVAERVTDGTRNISNQLSIRRNATLVSEDLTTSSDFAAMFSDGPDARSIRESRGGDLLAADAGHITPDTMMAILRDHTGGICMHGGFRSTASMVCQVKANTAPKIWMTWGPNPCETDFAEIPAP
ncbi:MAG: peptidase C69, partial [Alphaproteobacteria bacterium]|nr:peptidase C69 [Alphaproteobacteria bacterium]